MIEVAQFLKSEAGQKSVELGSILNWLRSTR